MTTDRAERFVTEEPIPAKDDGTPTEYENNVERVLGGKNPPAEPA